MVSFLFASFTGPCTITTAKNPNHYDMKKRRANPPPAPSLVFIQYKQWNRFIFSLKITRKYTFLLSDHCPWTSFESLFLGNIIKFNQKTSLKTLTWNEKLFFCKHRGYEVERRNLKQKNLVAKWKLPLKAKKSFSSPENFPFMSVWEETMRTRRRRNFPALPRCRDEKKLTFKFLHKSKISSHSNCGSFKLPSSIYNGTII